MTKQFFDIRRRKIVLLCFTLCCLAVFAAPAIPQDVAYHAFADQREIFSIRNCWNVISNVPFVIIGIWGIVTFLKQQGHASSQRVAYLILFAGIMAIGIGSAWYHYTPNNTTLVWDRIPMTITFMSYFSIIVSEYVDEKLGNRILVPLLVIGVFSVVYWYIGEQSGHGDLRLYALVQFYPMLAIPLILFLFPASTAVRSQVVLIIFVYAIAKMFEHWDGAIYSFHQLISGHSLKHLFAALSVFLILQTLQDRKKISA